MTKKEKIKQLINQQKAFMADVNQKGYNESEYWLGMTDYRKQQQDLAKQIHNDAHATYINEYRPSVKADVTSEGGWWNETKEKENE